MPNALSFLAPLLTLTLALTLAAPARAQMTPPEQLIRKVLAERLPQLKIDEINKSPVAGLWEVRYGGTEILYSDERGDHIFINGAIIETKTRTDLTEQRIDKMLALNWDKLPLKDAISIKQGSGKRKIAVFVDPNCGYCKRFERDIAGIKDVTIYTFLLPILGADSVAKSRDIWCAKEPAKAWRGWMLDNDNPERVAPGCDSKALERNTTFARNYRINATPAVIFEDGTRKPGAIPADLVEKLMASATAAIAAPTAPAKK